jgi:hypothetical protein
VLLGSNFVSRLVQCALFALAATTFASCSGAPQSSASNMMPTPLAETGSARGATTADARLASAKASALAWSGAYLMSTEIASAYPLMNQVATANTRPDLRIWHDDAALQSIVPWSHTYKLGDSIAAIRALAGDQPGAATIVYDIEHWAQTPASEQADPVGSIAEAAAVAHANGKMAGAAPDGRFMGIRGCKFDVSQGIVPKVNWKNVDLFNIQAQGLAQDSTCGAAAVSQFASFVSQVASIARASNPKIVIAAQISLSDSSPATALAAINAVQGAVNAIYVGCPYGYAGCNLSNLTQVLQAL